MSVSGVNVCSRLVVGVVLAIDISTILASVMIYGIIFVLVATLVLVFVSVLAA